MTIALITGTSTGIGQATALALARAGHNVYATMRTPDRSPLPAIAAGESLPLTVLALDVTDDAAVQRAFERILGDHGRVDVLVNNAGIGLVGAVEELPIEAFQQSIDTNLHGALRCIKAALPSMRAQRRGCIVNVTSVGGRIASAGQSAYNASKFALEAASEVLAQEVRSFNIRVAIVEPGMIATPIFDKLGELPSDAVYPFSRRVHAMFAASLARAVPPEVVAAEIKGIVEGDSWQLRYPVGPDARLLLAWRGAMTDEQWVERNAEPDDEAWCARMETEFRLDVRPFMFPESAV